MDVHSNGDSMYVKRTQNIRDNNHIPKNAENLVAIKINPQNNLIKCNTLEVSKNVLQRSHLVSPSKNNSNLDERPFDPMQCSITTNSAVSSLQQWMNGHFGNQSPVDFPRELTPPRTPESDYKTQASYKPVTQPSFSSIFSSRDHGKLILSSLVYDVTKEVKYTFPLSFVVVKSELMRQRQLPLATNAGE